MTRFAYYPRSSASRQYKGLEVTASATSEIERVDVCSDEPAAVMVSIDFTYTSTKGKHLADCIGGALAAFWHDDRGCLMVDVNHDDDARLTDISGRDIPLVEDEKITRLAGGLFNRSFLESSAERALVQDSALERLIECALDDYERELDEEDS